MGAFSGLDAAYSGLEFNRFWMDTIAHNIANVNTTTAVGQEPFRARMVVAVPIENQSLSGGGVAVGGVLERDGEAAQLFDPDHPLANAEGYIEGPVVELATELSNMILASRSYQANMTAFKEARDSLEETTRMGRA